MTISKLSNITEVPDVEVPQFETRLNESQVETMIQQYLSELTTTRETLPVKGLDLIDFLDLVRAAIISRQNTNGVAEGKRILFIEDMPFEELNTEAITWEVKSRVPGRFDQGPASSGRIKEVTPHCRSVVKHPDNPGERLVTFGKFYDNYISFNTYARNNKVALRRAFWLENIMDGFSWYFRLFGFRVTPKGLGERDIVEIGKLKLSKYPLSYHVRLDSTFTINTQELRSFLLNINIERS